jgi:hypothetical protein
MRTPDRAPAFLEQERNSAMQKRRRFKQTSTLAERLAEDTAHLREQAKLLPRGHLRDHVVRRIRQNKTAADIDLWLKSPGLQQPV